MRSDRLSSTVHTQAALASTAQQWLEAYPDLYFMARAAALKILKKLVGQELEPDTIYWHRFSGAASSSLTFNGWEHYGSPIESMTLIELVVRRFSAGDQDDVDDLQWEGGFYAADSKQGVYNQTNEVRLLPQDVLRELWSIDFAQAYRTKMRAFWQNHADDFLELSRINFQATLINARNQGTLTEQDLRALQRGAAASLTAPTVLKDRQDTAMAHQGLSVRTFDIAGYKARDILRIVDAQGRQLLYMPAQAPGLLVFDSEAAVYQWVRERAAKPASREGLLAHFSISGVDIGPLQRLLATLPNTVQSASKPLLNQREQVIEGDAFVYLRDTARHEMEAQAHQLLTSNAQLRKQLWIGYLGAFAQVFTPFAPLGWPVALVLVGAGVASVGLRIDQAVNARSADERKSGILGAIVSAIGLLFDAIALFSTRPALNAPVTFNGEISGGLRLRTSISSPARELLVANPDMQGIELSPRGYWNRLGFIERSDRTPLFYTREISGREDPARVPMLGFADSQVSRVAGNLLDGRVLRTFGSVEGACLHAQAEYEAAYAVYEIDAMDVRSVSARENLGANERFTVSQLAPGSDARRLGDAVQDAYLHDLVHVDNALIDSSRIKLRPVEEWEEQHAIELVHAAPPGAVRVVESTVLHRVRVVPPAFGQVVNSYGIETEGGLQIVKYDPCINVWRKPSGRAWRFDPARDRMVQVNNPDAIPWLDATRQQENLRALGLRVNVPYRVEPMPTTGLQPVPRKIHSIWIGKKMPHTLLNNMQRNAVEAAKGLAPFDTHLYLSIGAPAELVETLEDARRFAPRLKIEILEGTPFFQEFRNSKYYEQYLAASTGGAVNYASAVDVLRYRLIYREGGIYLDVDDRISSFEKTGMLFGNHPFTAGKSQFLLNTPVSHEQLGMICEFNTSHFGSLANNPVLNAVSEESFIRFKADRDLYLTRPYAKLDSREAMNAYARRINYTTGPGVFNAVIDQELPNVRQFRLLHRLTAGEIYLADRESRDITRALLNAEKEYAALAQLFDIRSTGSWLHTR